MLIPLNQATLSEVYWVWHKPHPALGHIYQLGIRDGVAWHNNYPTSLPICGEPGGERKAHDHFVPDHKYPWTPGSVCVRCAVQLVIQYPHLFEKGGQ